LSVEFEALFSFRDKGFFVCLLILLRKTAMVKMTLKCIKWFVVAAMLTSGVAMAENAELAKGMSMLKAETAKLGSAKAENGVLYFGATKINDNFDVVDSVKKAQGGTATLFVKNGSAYIRVSTNVIKGGKRAIGTRLDPQGPAIAAINDGKAFYGIVDILGKLYDTGYEPIKNAQGETVGIYYVGYMVE
jgi:hypothetical protein